MVSVVLNKFKSRFSGNAHSGREVIKLQKVNKTRPVTEVFLIHNF